MANPSETSREELYDFLSYRELPITSEGTFIAYKGVGEDIRFMVTPKPECFKVK